MAQRAVQFGFQVAPTGGRTDRELYREVVEDCVLGHELGYHAAWLLEHHFSDYYPTPSPLLHMANIAGHVPALSLGTSVLVLPWYHPVRLAEEIAMVNAMCEGELHLGIGRGTAKMEYDAYNVDMNEARGRFDETLRILRLAERRQPFTFDGQHYSVPRPVRVRPDDGGKPVHYYGAIGSPASARIMGQLGLPPFCLSQFPDKYLRRILSEWHEEMATAGHDADTVLPISIRMFIADTTDQAIELGRRYLPYYFDLQARHYEVDADHWHDIPDYQAFSKMFANMKLLADPDNLGPYMTTQLIGDADSIARRIEGLMALGFNYFLLGGATPGVPQEVRQEQYRRFAGEILPRFADVKTAASPVAAGD